MAGESVSWQVNKSLSESVSQIATDCQSGYQLDCKSVIDPISQSIFQWVNEQVRQSIIRRQGISVAAPKLWNELPLDLRSLVTINLFKKHLKTDLFKKAYNV